MKFRLPNIGLNGAATRSSSFKHMDSVFSALVLLTNIIGLASLTSYLSALQVSYQRVSYMVNVNATATIAELKRVRLAYIHWVRGGPEPGLDPAAQLDEPEQIVVGVKEGAGKEGLAFVHEENILTTLVIQAVVDWRNGLSKSTPAFLLRFYDIITIAFLDLNRVIIMPAKPNFSTITDAHTSVYGAEVHKPTDSKLPDGTLVSRPTTAFGKADAKLTHDIPFRVDEILLEFGWSKAKVTEAYKAACRAQKFYIINSAGPNGPSTWTAYSDAMALMNNHSVLNALNQFCIASGLKRFVKKMLGTIQLRAQDTLPTESLKLGKLITFGEWGGKTRIVASCDYWTQIILTPLHDTLFNILRTLPTDATFDQRSAAETIRQWSADPKAELYSYDLTAATDRLPVSLQARILNAMLNVKDLGRWWAELLVYREFVTETGESYKYAVGAPMGSKSNWAMLAITHHMIVRYCAISLKMPKFENYRICGDDVVINSTAVATKYKEVMDYLGLTINESKSIMHSQGLTPAAEFCKRVFIKGSEYTALPTKLIAKTVMNGRLLPQLQAEVQSRGLEFEGSKLFSWLGGLVDGQSHSFLALLNTLPTSVTGLVSPIPLPVETPKLEEWWTPHHKLLSNDIVQGYTYVAATEQLKRLDALLRQTMLINDMIATAMATTYGVKFDTAEWFVKGTNPQLASLLKTYKTDLSPSHPLVEASQREAIRVSLLLTKISNASEDLEAKTRAGLLDVFRNSLTSMWEDVDAARAQADRTLIVRVLDVLEEMMGKITADTTSEERAAMKVAKFSTRLQHLDRNWTIRWALGENLTVNTFKSKVVMSSTAAESQASTNATILPIRRQHRN